jgi:hypothetical protein
MDAMPTSHKDYRARTSEHIIFTNWAILIQITLNATMIIFQIHRQADVTFITVKVIDTKSSTNTT